MPEAKAVDTEVSPLIIIASNRGPFSFKTQEDDIKGYKLSIFGRPIVTLSWNFKFGNYASD